METRVHLRIPVQPLSVPEGDMNMNFDYAVGKCGDQGDRDRSGLTLWQVWRPTRQRQKVKLKQDPALSFQEAVLEVSTQLIGKKQS